MQTQLKQKDRVAIVLRCRTCSLIQVDQPKMPLTKTTYPKVCSKAGCGGKASPLQDGELADFGKAFEANVALSAAGF